MKYRISLEAFVNALQAEAGTERERESDWGGRKKKWETIYNIFLA